MADSDHPKTLLYLKFLFSAHTRRLSCSPSYPCFSQNGEADCSGGSKDGETHIVMRPPRSFDDDGDQIKVSLAVCVN